MKRRLPCWALIIGLLAWLGVVGQHTMGQGDFKIVKEWKGGFSGVNKPGQRVIKDGKAWAELWNEVHSHVTPKPEVPAVDFDKYMVLAVFMGTKNTGGFAIRITNIQYDEKADKLRVAVQETSPAPGSIVIQAITQPFHIVVVPRSDKAVEFKIEKTVGK
ncbi:hypothetical protein HRbin36_00176 [bacterium HR36]|nr:hypothetical protein HRbin36_00176 [bacterium HR36]